ncbi:hypothetical protein NX801_07615 [Streptomyces sp. LP05-1]|uniref:Uncharacterized protein n=1 Tax=Streptomyces pyxinae TaxID=2970734 RepID=A0ABT2CDP2_9ACTN|nr:hypothetical protein [Streptomyces sp. LP05-1]MCS0635527.1 hypothetical protein [Streptomyces sp. LP05-1]
MTRRVVGATAPPEPEQRKTPARPTPRRSTVHWRHPWHCGGASTVRCGEWRHMGLEERQPRGGLQWRGEPLGQAVRLFTAGARGDRELPAKVSA